VPAFGELDDAATGSATFFGLQRMIRESLELSLAPEIAVANLRLQGAKETEQGKSAYPFRGPDRSRPAERDDTEEFDQW
jgi:hypothetical protein